MRRITLLVIGILLAIGIPSVAAAPSIYIDSPYNGTYIRNTTITLNWTMLFPSNNDTVYNAFYSIDGGTNQTDIFYKNRSTFNGTTKFNISFGSLGELSPDNFTSTYNLSLGFIPKESTVYYVNVTLTGFQNFQLFNKTRFYSVGDIGEPNINRNSTNFFLGGLSNTFGRMFNITWGNAVDIPFGEIPPASSVQAFKSNGTNYIVLRATGGNDQLEYYDSSLVSIKNISFSGVVGESFDTDSNDGVMNFAYVFTQTGTPINTIKEINIHTGESTLNLTINQTCTRGASTNGISLNKVGDNSSFWITCPVEEKILHVSNNGTLLSNVSVTGLFPSPLTEPHGLETSDGINFFIANLGETGIHEVNFTFPTNIRFDVGANQSIDNQINGSLLNTTELSLNVSAFNEYLRQCTTDPCSVKINISTASGGILEVSKIEIGYGINASFAPGFGVHKLDLYGNSTQDSINLTTVYFTSAVGLFNGSIYNEMTEGLFDISSTGLNSTEFRAYCPDKTEKINVTSNVQNFSVFCDYDQLELRMSWNDVIGTVYRTLIPSSDVQNLRFYMPDIINDTSVFQQVILDDATGAYLTGNVRIDKILSDGTKTMINQLVSAAGDIYALLVLNEQYIFTVQSSGQPDRTVGTIRGVNSPSIIINIPPLSAIPQENFQLRDVGWGFFPNASTRTIRFVYNDTLNSTTQLTFDVVNASNTSQQIGGTPTTVIPTSPATSITITVPDENSTYLASFTANHATLGTITDSFVVTFLRRIINLVGVPEAWYNIIGLGTVILIALLFGSFHAGVGSFATAMAGSMMYFFGFIDSVVGFGVIMLVIMLAGAAMIGNRRNE